MTDAQYHLPVMLAESIDGLDIKPNGAYVDLTFGGGGHSREILRRLDKKGRLVAFDQDGDAQTNAQAISDKRFTFVRGNFAYLHNYLRYLGIASVDGILGDLGVSWHQFDTAERGFSFRFNAALDMRMNTEAKITASDILNGYEVQDLARILRQYGELDKASVIARMIVQARDIAPITMVGDLLSAIKDALPKAGEHKFLAKIFQALRIEVNREMEALEQALIHSAKALTAGGRMVVITYHSLEDRAVKNFIRAGNIDGTSQKDIYGSANAPFTAVCKKPILPTEQEIADNPRSRSAKLRIAEKWTMDN
jgi:16S rRNA (cytosine1402-N4)-methyltransferase